MAKISRAQLEKDLQDYKDSLEASKGLPNSVIENNIKYNPSTGRLEYSMPDDLNEIIEQLKIADQQESLQAD